MPTELASEFQVKTFSTTGRLVKAEEVAAGGHVSVAASGPNCVCLAVDRWVYKISTSSSG